jgi:hypothetical protein
VVETRELFNVKVGGIRSYHCALKCSGARISFTEENQPSIYYGTDQLKRVPQDIAFRKEDGKVLRTVRSIIIFTKSCKHCMACWNV